MVALRGRRASPRGAILAIVVLSAALVLGSGPVAATAPPPPPPIVPAHAAPERSEPPSSVTSAPSGVSGSFPPPNWRLLNTSGPAPVGVGGSLAFLPASQAVVWVGGVANGNVQTWEFTGGHWSNVTATSTGAPPANSGGRLAAAPFRDEVAWVSPYAGGASMGLWTFANGTWTNASSLTPAPPARVDPAWAADPLDGAIVLFGGEANGVYLNDTWTLDATGWSSVPSSPAPAPRADPGLTAPGSTVGLVLAGGVGYAGAYADTWTFSSGNWSLRTGAGTPSGITFGPNALASTPGGDVIAFGGAGCPTPNGLCNETFEYAPALDQWEHVSSQYPPSPRAGMQLTYDPAGGFDLAFGGSLGAGNVSTDSWAIGGPLVNTLVVSPTIAQPPSLAHFESHAGGGYGTYTFFYHGQNVDCVSENLSNYPCALDNDDEGNYTVVAQVTDQLGNVTNATAPFDVLLALTVLSTLSAAAVDVGQPVNYSMVVSAPSVPSLIQWQDLPPDCPVANASSFNCTSFDPGFYGVSCVVTDQFGTVSTSTTTQLVIAPAPTALAWSSVTAGLAPLTVGFDSRVLGGTAPYVYNWSYGDGAYGDTAAPTHTYATNGTFAVNLTITDAAGYVAYSPGTLVVAVAPPLAVNIAASAASWIAPATVQLTAGVVGGTAPYTYQWTLGNGDRPTQATVTASYGTAGTYTVALVVVDAHGLVATASSSLTITASNASQGTGGGGATTLPSWELPAVGVAGAVVGLLAGVVLGRRRPGASSDHATEP